MPLVPVYCEHGAKRILLCAGVLPGSTVWDPRCKDSKGVKRPHVAPRGG